MIAPLPLRGGATVMAEPSRDQPMSLALRPAPHWPSRIPRRLASLRRKRRPRSRAWPWRSDSARRRRSPLLQMPEAGERHLQPEHAEQGDGRSRHDEHDQPQTVQRPEPGHDGAERGRALKRPHGAGPERGGGHRERPAVEPEAQPQRGVLAVGHHVGRERRRHGKAETGGGDIHGPISGDRPRRPGAAGREQDKTQAPVPSILIGHIDLPSVHGMHCGHGQLPAPPRRLRAPMRTAPMREMPATAAPPVRSLPSSPAPARPPIQSRTAEGSRSISLKEAFISP